MTQSEVSVTSYGPIRRRRASSIAAAALCGAVVALGARTASTADTVYFSAVDNVSAALVQKINAETVRIDMSAWYLDDSSVYTALLNRFRAGVQVRLMGDRGSIFEIDQNTRDTFEYLASQGVPIRLRYNPTWYPEIDHWKATIFAGQNVVAFGSANYTVYELAPFSSSNYNDEVTLFTTDSTIVNAFRTKFDRMWNDTTPEPESLVSSPPYYKNWNDACALESACSDYYTKYPNPVPMVIDTARLEPDYPLPADLIWGQGPDFNDRLTQEISSENTRVDLAVYRLTVDNITQALHGRFQAGVPVRLIIEPNEYLNRRWPEFWITHANIDSLWAAGVAIKQRLHEGNTHMKVLVTSSYTTVASSNFTAAWQRDHDYFVSAATKSAVYTSIKNRFETMWNDTSGFRTFVPQSPDAPSLASPSSGSTGVSTTPTLVWTIATFATNYDVLLGTSSSSLTRVGNVQAQLVNNPPSTYSWTAGSALQCTTTYYWQIVSRTNATPRDPSLVNPSPLWSFTTGSSNCGGGGGGGLPSPWVNQDIGSTGISGSATYARGVFTVSGAGADIWGTSDSFQFVSQPWSGDGQIVARVTGEQNTNTYAKAGVMIRQSLTPTSAHVILDVKPDGGIEFMTRSVAGGATTSVGSLTRSIPIWLKLARSGSTITGYVSTDGSTWTTVGTTSTTTPSSTNFGLAVTSHNTNALNTSTFDNVSVTSGGSPPPPPGTPTSPNPANGATGASTSPTLTWSASGATAYDVRFGTANPPPTVSSNQTAASYTPSTLANSTTYYWQIIAKNAAGSTTGPLWSFTTTAAGGGLPSPWANQDVGTTGLAGSASYSNGTFSVSGAGADIWGNSDAFQFVYQPLGGDGQIVARVTGVQNTNTYAKGGAMLRQSLTATSPHVILDVRPDGSVEFMTRSLDGGATTFVAGASVSFPAFLKLVRSGSTVSGYWSADGSNWTTVGTTTVSFSSANIGLAVTSHNTSALNTSTFDSVGVTAGAPPPPPPSAPNIVIYASDFPAANRHGAWTSASDPTSPDGTKLVTANAGAPTVSTPLANPTDYVDVTFSASAGTPYTLWLRVQATANNKSNDSLWVQFADAFAGGSQVYQMNTTAGLAVNLATDSSGGSDQGWGWVNSAYWLSQATTVSFPTTGSHTLRIQVREDGVQFDQIVLSPSTYFNASASCPTVCGGAPGPASNDNTFVPKP